MEKIDEEEKIIHREMDRTMRKKRKKRRRDERPRSARDNVLKTAS